MWAFVLVFFLLFPPLISVKINCSNRDGQNAAGLILKLQQAVRCCENLFILCCVTCYTLIISVGLMIGFKND